MRILVWFILNQTTLYNRRVISDQMEHPKKTVKPVSPQIEDLLRDQINDKW